MRRLAAAALLSAAASRCTCITPNFYARLGVNPTAGAQDIKAAFRSAALRNHPDKHRGLESEDAAQLAMEELKRLA